MADERIRRGVSGLLTVGIGTPDTFILIFPTKSFLKFIYKKQEVQGNDGIQHFQFTLDNSKLNSEQRAFYEENGFLVIKNLVKHEHLERWRMRFLDLIEGRVYNQNMTKMKDIALKDRKDIPPERVINKIQDFIWDEILDYVECFTGPNIMAVHTMLINKPPDPGTRSSRHPLHQDLYYFPFRPANRIVCAWTAMEKVHRDNGCLFVVPGSHKGKLEQHVYPDWEVSSLNNIHFAYIIEIKYLQKCFSEKNIENKEKMLEEERIGNLKWTKLDFNEMQKSSRTKANPPWVMNLQFHHSTGTRILSSFHHFRKAISCHYAASDCHYIDVRGTLQENIAKEVEEVAKRRGLEDPDYKVKRTVYVQTFQTFC
ncbi:Phytanoyl-CoA dioxygenase, peroxisomal [Armadillidium nasatum]|uniref:phytanoyl-CoA dioxygenase n=1 Tax=Armadillidium nasatum TaxID=96803 RepID=A0A5N5T276_9CRUS|nr:Phytanoyl-CoA dioxygenase, peroxisomal [Armadillidium nasatum]